jgi:hypothetical protein
MEFEWKESWNTWKEDWSEHPPSQDEVRIIEFLKKREPHYSKTLLEVGIGNSTLAKEVRTFDKIVGLTVIQAEIDKAKSLNLENYEVLLCNKHTIFFLDLPKFDVIVDNGILTFTDCEVCTYNLFHSFLRLLKPEGVILTDSFGMFFSKHNTPQTFRRLFEKFEIPLEVVEYRETSPHFVVGLKQK